MTANAAPPSPDTPPAERAADPAKPFYLSTTFWLNAAALGSMAFPAVREWLEANPVELVAALAAANVLLRFVTRGKISLVGDSTDGNGGAGVLLLAGCMIAGVCGFSLVACSSLNSTAWPDFSGMIYYRDSGSGAKGGLEFKPGKSPEGFIRVPIYDPETGEMVGLAELHGPLAGAVKPVTVEPSGK